MQILAKCPRCGQILQFDSSAADKRKRCPKCMRLFKVPALDHLKKATKVIEDANTTIFVDEDGKKYG